MAQTIIIRDRSITRITRSWLRQTIPAEGNIQFPFGQQINAHFLLRK